MQCSLRWISYLQEPDIKIWTWLTNSSPCSFVEICLNYNLHIADKQKRSKGSKLCKERQVMLPSVSSEYLTEKKICTVRLHLAVITTCIFNAKHQCYLTQMIWKTQIMTIALQSKTLSSPPPSVYGYVINVLWGKCGSTAAVTDLLDAIHCLSNNNQIIKVPNIFIIKKKKISALISSWKYTIIQRLKCSIENYFYIVKYYMLLHPSP